MTKSEFVDSVADASGLSKKDAGSAVDAVLKSHVAQRGAREGRNPRTGETMQIAATKVPRFTAGSGLKKAIK